MFEAFYCIGKQHNLWLVVLAALVCFVGTSTSIRLLLMAGSKPRQEQARWLLGSGASAGAGTWATHFIAMLAYDPGFNTGYDPLGTAASLVIAIAGCTGCIFAGARLRKPWGMLVASGLFSLGVGAMHYTGMWALRAPGTLSWRPSYVVASFIVAALLAAAAHKLLRRPPSRGVRIGSSAILAVAICSLHFTGMAALIITPDPTVFVPQSLLPHDEMAILVGALASLLLLAFLATTMMEARAKTASLSLLRSVIEVMPQGLAYYDQDDRLVLGNDTYRRQLASFGMEARIGASYREILEQAAYHQDIPAARGRPEEWIRERMAARESPDEDRDQPLADGRIVRVEHRSTSGGGRMTVFSDITGLARQSEDLAAALSAAEVAMRAKNEFLANMSHELRTPMNGIIGATDLLAAEPLTTRQAELVQVARSAGQILNRLLCDILDLAKAGAGALEIDNAPYDLRLALDEVLTPFREAAEAKGLTLQWKMAPGIPQRLIGDGARVRQILENLVSNAIKFTEHGGVDVEIRRDGDLLCIGVSDTGIGVEPAVRTRLFGRFEQADGSLTRRHGGAGLGLAIAQELAVRMGGALGCESTPGLGSTFTLTLPLQAADEASDAEPATGAEPSEAANVLVVDDNPTNRRVLGLILEGVGIHAAFAEDGQAGVEAWRRDTPDAVLMDIQMPVMDGLTAIRTIRDLERREGRAATPIIVVSANAMAEDVAASAAAGADGHLGKPVDAAALFSALERVERRSLEAAAA